MQKELSKYPLFEMGTLVQTRNVQSKLNMDETADLLYRHSHGDWGNLSDEDIATNEAALADGWRIMSCYTLKGITYWVITEWDRSATTLLLPEEY